MTITCVIEYEIDPHKSELFEQYARNWEQIIPRNGASLVGYFGPHEGSLTTAYGIYHIDNLAAYEAYRARLSSDPMGRENYTFAKEHKFIRQENRLFLKRIAA
ncbi:MAG: NIPSNAP family protein [Pseudomonadota bacterium]